MSNRIRIQQKEAQHFCERKSHYPKLASSHRPTLEELQSTTLVGYVRKALAKSQVYPEVKDDDDIAATIEISEDKKAPRIEYREGMMKISLPNGFWEEEGIAKDRTARGIHWQDGTPLGDFIIPSPIKQCIRGIGGIYEFTFLDQPPISVSKFRDLADEYAKKHNATITPTTKEEEEKKESSSVCDGDDQEQDDLTYFEEIQRKFWKRLGPTMPPSIYGADLEGSYFGNDPASGWNIGKLDNCLHLLGKVPGVTSPYLYFGMWGAVFCAHTEDMELLSINFLHAGAPKIWYAIAPGQESKRFEELCKGYYADGANECSEFLRHKRYLLSPKILKKAGIRYTVQVQRPGDAMITIPGAYHFGFNAGFNVAESTNFAVPEWIPYGYQAKVCLCRPDSVRIDMNRLERSLAKYSRDTKGKHISWREWGLLQEATKSTSGSSSTPAPKTTTTTTKKKTTTPIKKTTAAKGKATVTKKAKSSVEAKTKNKTNNNTQSPQLSKQEQKKEFWVVVMHPSSSSSDKKSTTKKNSKNTSRKVNKKKQTNQKGRKRKQGDEEENDDDLDWHLAKPIKNRKLYPNTRVLCMQFVNKEENDNSNRTNVHADDDDEDEEECFLGTIVEVADDYARVHFDGLPKSQDVWMPVHSPKLFFDGGKWGDSAEAKKGLSSTLFWKEMDSKELDIQAS